jgi:L-lactate dehydrogenase complex protein LldG
MSSAREGVLGRIGAALGPSPVVPVVPREYRQAGSGSGSSAAAAVVELFCERAADYLATVVRVAEHEVEDALAGACQARGSQTVVAAPGVQWRVPGVDLTQDTPDTAPAELDGLDAALTGCALAIAETGSIVLDGGPASGRRALTLVPDHHLCVVRAEQIVPGVPDAVAELAEAAREGRPITFVSGPSATSDIELERVEGVHGPRKLDILVVADASSR